MKLLTSLSIAMLAAFSITACSDKISTTETTTTAGRFNAGIFSNEGIMKHTVITKIHINATPDKVWTILTNFKDYPTWNPFIQSLTGDVNVGSTIIVNITPPNAKPMIFEPTVISLAPNREFSWLGHFWVTGLFDGWHQFELIDNLDGSTLFVQREDFSGLLVRLFKGQLDNNTKRGFETMNSELKKLAER